MNQQRIYIISSLILICISFLLDWTAGLARPWLGINFGLSALLILITYIGLLLVIFVEITERPLDHKRLLVLIVVPALCGGLMSSELYEFTERSIRINGLWASLGWGYFIFIAGNLFIVGYSTFYYQQQFLKPPAHSDILDNLK